MSLTSLISTKAIQGQLFTKQEQAAIEAQVQDHNNHLRFAQRVSVPGGTDFKNHPHSLIGTAVSYLIRMKVAGMDVGTAMSALGLRSWMAEMEHLYPKVFDPTKVANMVGDTLNSGGYQDLADFALGLAIYEKILRDGRKPSTALRNAEMAMLDEHHVRLDIMNIIRRYFTVKQIHPSPIWDSVTMNPTFDPFSKRFGGADCPMVADDQHIWMIKTSSKRSPSDEELITKGLMYAAMMVLDEASDYPQLTQGNLAITDGDYEMPIPPAQNDLRFRPIYIHTIYTRQGLEVVDVANNVFPDWEMFLDRLERWQPITMKQRIKLAGGVLPDRLEDGWFDPYDDDEVYDDYFDRYY
jgi:hypothetical protein